MEASGAGVAAGAAHRQGGAVEKGFFLILEKGIWTKE
jgi:hypothetical protein